MLQNLRILPWYLIRNLLLCYWPYVNSYQCLCASDSLICLVIPVYMPIFFSIFSCFLLYELITFTFSRLERVLANANFPNVVIPRDERTNFFDWLEMKGWQLHDQSVCVTAIIIVCRRSLVYTLERHDWSWTHFQDDSLSYFPTIAHISPFLNSRY